MFHYDDIDAAKLMAYPPYSNNCWEKFRYNRVKQNLKTYYCRSQKRICTYCKTELEVGCDADHIEHIVHKEFRPQWMFEPLNLGISCSHCNTAKGVQHALHRFAQRAVVLPVASRFYKIIHPHFDVYSDHIELEDGLFVKAITHTKGEETIRMCRLWRPLFADRRARAMSISQSGRYTIALARSQQPGIRQEELNAFLDYIDELLDMI